MFLMMRQSRAGCFGKIFNFALAQITPSWNIQWNTSDVSSLVQCQKDNGPHFLWDFHASLLRDLGSPNGREPYAVIMYDCDSVWLSYNLNMYSFIISFSAVSTTKNKCVEPVGTLSLGITTLRFIWQKDGPISGVLCTVVKSQKIWLINFWEKEK